MKQASHSKNASTPKLTLSKGQLISLIAGLLAIVILLSVLLFIPKNPVLRYGGITVTKEMYSYWFSLYKEKRMIGYGIYGYQDALPATWDAPSDTEGMTVGEEISAAIHNDIKMKLVAAVLYDKLGAKSPISQRAYVKEYIAEMLEYRADGDKAELRALAEKYGTTVKAIKKCAAIDLKAELYFKYLEDTSTGEMTNTEVNTFYINNYKRFKVLYLNKEKKGTMENGERVEVDLTEQEKAARTAIDTVLKTYLYNGENAGTMTVEKFDEYLKNSDEGLHSADAYPDGLYVSRYNSLGDGVLEAEVIEEVGHLREGQLLRTETENGIRYIFNYPLLSAPYNSPHLEPFFTGFFANAAAYTVAARVAAKVAEVKDFPDNRKDITVYTVPYNSDFEFCRINK